MATDPVGKRVEVFFDDDQSWYEGVVSSYKSDLKGNAITRRIKISYDDGTTSAWLDPTAEQEEGQLKYKDEQASFSSKRAGPSSSSSSQNDSANNKRQKASAPSSSRAIVVAAAALPAAVPAQPRDLMAKTNNESELLSGPAAGQKGITREALGKSAEPLGLSSSAIQGAICTKGGAVSHLVLNEEFNDLAPSASEVQEFWVSDGTQRNKNAQMLNPATNSPQSSIPIFWNADKQNRKGGDLAVYVGHFTSLRVSTFSVLVPFKKAARRSLVELRFENFDVNFAKKLDAVSDGDGVKSKAKVKSEVKTEVKSEAAAGPSGSGKGKAKAKAEDKAAAQKVLVEFKFRSCETYLVGDNQWEGVLHVPMLQDPSTGRCTLAEGKTTAKGKVSRHDDFNDGDEEEEQFTMTFARSNGNPIHGFSMGYTLDFAPEEFGVQHGVRTNESPKRDSDMSSEPFEARGQNQCRHLDVWEKHAGGLLQAYASAYMDTGEWTLDPYGFGLGHESGSDSGSDTESHGLVDDAVYKLKLYTVLSAHKPNESTAKAVKWDKGAGADWGALEALVAARFPKKSAAWPRHAVAQYRLFVELKIEQGDFESTKFSPSGPLDEVWHTHLSFVDRYQRDILALTSGARRIIEHSPVLGNEAYSRYAAAHKAHVARMKRIGGKVDDEFWPAPKTTEKLYKEPHDYDSDDHLEMGDYAGQPSCG